MGDYASDITAERARRTISGYVVDKSHSERLYEKKLTAANLKKCGDFYKEAIEVAKSVPKGNTARSRGRKWMDPQSS